MKCSIEDCTEPRMIRQNGRSLSLCRQHQSELGRVNAHKRRSMKKLSKGRWITTSGYVMIENEVGSLVMEHQVVMAQKLGRELRARESVHHLDGNRQNNHPDNLELWLGQHRSGQRASDVVCPHCGKPYGSP